MRSIETFFTWQYRALGWLLAWGIGSVIIGAGLARARRDLIRQVGVQAIAWGAIDAALALNGRIAARRKQSDPTASASEAANSFQKIVAVNTCLDLLYILGGWRLMRDRRSGRQGVGWGVLIQGAFLLVYDAILTWRSNEWRR